MSLRTGNLADEFTKEVQDLNADQIPYYVDLHIILLGLGKLPQGHCVSAAKGRDSV